MKPGKASRGQEIPTSTCTSMKDRWLDLQTCLSGSDYIHLLSSRNIASAACLLACVLLHEENLSKRGAYNEPLPAEGPGSGPSNRPCDSTAF